MLSDEEKEAIEQLRSWREYIIKHKEDVNKANDIEFYLRTTINLIEKQSKEIEESKQKEKEAYNFGYRNGCNDTSKFNDKTFIRIDKIKAKIEEYKKQQKEEPDAYLCIKVLQSVLEKE